MGCVSRLERESYPPECGEALGLSCYPSASRETL